MTFQVWFTADEIAGFVRANGITYFPATKRGVNKHADGANWTLQPVTVASAVGVAMVSTMGHGSDPTGRVW